MVCLCGVSSLCGTSSGSTVVYKRNDYNYTKSNSTLVRNYYRHAVYPCLVSSSCSSPSISSHTSSPSPLPPSLVHPSAACKAPDTSRPAQPFVRHSISSRRGHVLHGSELSCVCVSSCVSSCLYAFQAPAAPCFRAYSQCLRGLTEECTLRNLIRQHCYPYTYTDLQAHMARLESGSLLLVGFRGLGFRLLPSTWQRPDAQKASVGES